MPVVTLNEGNTPLIEAATGRTTGSELKVYLKFEGLNLTGSFKDRGMTMAISKALGEGARRVIRASTGTLRRRRRLTPHVRELKLSF